MSTISFPSDLRIGAGSGFGQARYDVVGSSDATGSQQARLFGPPRWQLRLVQPPVLTAEQAAVWTALVMRLRGRVNHLAAGDPRWRAPRGTLRGTIVTTGSHAIGDTTLNIDSSATGTLLRGDYLQVGSGLGTSQLVMVVADVTTDGSGVAAVTIEPPLRLGFTAGTAVTWDRPVAYFRQSVDASQWTYIRGPALPVTGFSLDLLEAWS